MKKILGIVFILALTALITSVYLTKHYDIHYCKYWCPCSDNCKENGYYAMFKDSKGNVYALKMTNEYERMVNKKYIIISRKGSKRIFSITPINDNEMFNRQPQFVYNVWRQ